MTAAEEMERAAVAELRAIVAELEASELRLVKLGFRELAMSIYDARLRVSGARRSFEVMRADFGPTSPAQGEGRDDG